MLLYQDILENMYAKNSMLQKKGHPTFSLLKSADLKDLSKNLVSYEDSLYLYYTMVVYRKLAGKRSLPVAQGSVSDCPSFYICA